MARAKRHYILGPGLSERISMWSLNINEEKKLLILKFSDTLTLNELSDILKAIYIENDGANAFYNRFVDMTDLKVIEIDFDTFSSRINKYRRLTKPDNPVKISLFIPENYIGGFPQLYKSMLSNDQFSIEISDSIEECAEYLSVDKKLLEDAVK
jgi:hypothetical protein